jgi:hypothetical protein
MRKHNGVQVDLDYQTYDCPYLQSEWDSGIITLLKDDKSLVLNFAEIAE